MRFPMRSRVKEADNIVANDIDPREEQSAEIIDFASRNGYPSVTQRKGASDGLGLAAGVGVVALLGFAAFWGMNSARMDDGTAVTQSVEAPQSNGPIPIAEIPIQQPVGGIGNISAPSAAQIDPAPAPVLANQPVNAAVPRANPNASPILTYDVSGLPAGMAGPAAAAPSGAPAGSAGTGSSADFASRVGGVGGATAQAKPLANPETTVTQGTLIPAILETAIDTNVPGFVRAVVSQDVRSFDGKNVLVPRSSRLIGQYQSGLQNGQKRAYVIWTRLIRPDGASVALQSPAVGFDGTTGLQGQVKSNFFQKFGSAILLSVVGGLTAVTTGGASVVLGGGQSAAATAIQQNGDIGPTIRVRQGAPIRVFTARDLDFSEVS